MKLNGRIGIISGESRTRIKEAMMATNRAMSAAHGTLAIGAIRSTKPRSPKRTNVRMSR